MNDVTECQTRFSLSPPVQPSGHPHFPMFLSLNFAVYWLALLFVLLRSVHLTDFFVFFQFSWLSSLILPNSPLIVNMSFIILP